jgi:LacI family transcriptional regulator, galactose operon repressor
LAKLNLQDPTALYMQIQKDIIERIKRNEFKVGDKLKSQNELVEFYDVSLITVKKALANLLSAGIIYSRIGKGTFIADQKNKLDLTKHKSLGMLLQSLEHPFFTPLISRIESEANKNDYNILLSSSAGNLSKEDTQIEHFRQIGTDGLIIASLSLKYVASKALRKIHDENYPYVMVSYVHDPDIWYVGTDHELGAYLATEHLIKQGYKNIGIIHGGKGNTLGEIRKNGWLRAIEKYHIDYYEKNIFYLENKIERYESGYNLGKRFAKLTDRPEALFIYTDSAALGFQKAVMEEGLKIPDDIAIIGFNDIESAKHAAVPLSTISQPIKKIGEVATQTVISRINGIEVPNRVIINPKLIVRESSKK